MDKRSQIFISYSKQDKEIADLICHALEKRLIPCWIAPRDIDVGEDWADQIVKAIESNKSFVVIISDHSMESNEVLKEITLASEMKKKIFAICINGCELSKGYKYHLSIAQRMDLCENNLEEIIDKLEAKIRDTKEGPVEVVKEEKIEDLQIVTYYELTKKRGLNKSEIARQLVANDRKLYHNIDDDNEGDPSQWETYLSKYPQTFRYMVNSQNQIVGNWSMVTLSGADYRRAKEGKLLESELNIGSTEYFMFGGVFYGYLLNLSVNEEEMSPTNIRRLFESFLDQLDQFAKEDIYFKSWCVNVFLEDHEKRYEALGFTYACDNVKSGKMYTLDLWPYPKNKIFQKRKKLKQMYENKFSIRCRQLKSGEEVDSDLLESIAGLIYDTDPYIYPAMFGTRDNALELVPELIRENDTMFRLDNLYIAEYEEEIIGLVLWVRGKLTWSKEQFVKVAKDHRIPVSGYLDQVTDRYIRSYADIANEEAISVINFCISEEVRGIGTGSQLMESFLREHRGEQIELCVLEENSGAVRLYQKYGFTENERYRGFSVDDRELVCISMEKK